MSKKLDIRKMQVYHDYFSRLKCLALSAFQWNDLPETCSERFLENTLFHHGDAVFVDDPERKFLTLKVTPCSEVNVYDDYIAYTAYGTGYTRVFDANKCVYIRNNYLAKSTESTVVLFAERLALLELMMQVNLNAQKTPVLIRTDEKTKTSLQAVYNQFEGNSHLIFGTKTLSDRPLEVLKTDAPFLVDRLRSERREVWNEALEFLGVNTNPSDRKKERLIVNEVEANNEQIDLQASTMLIARMNACEEINKKFGLNVSVKLRVDEIKKLRGYVEEREEKEENENGELHS